MKLLRCALCGKIILPVKETAAETICCGQPMRELVPNTSDGAQESLMELTPYLEKRLDELVEKYDFLSCRRGKGFMQGLVVTGRPVGEILKKALENDLIILSAGSDVIRLVPPLVIEKEHIDEMIEKLEKSF